MRDRDLEIIEREAYRDSFSDGLIDLYLGASIAWIGAAWVWFPDFAAFAGIIPAVGVIPMLMGRKAFVESRAGHVEWSQPRRRRERRSLLMALASGLVVFLVAVTMLVVLDPGSDTASIIAPGLMAWLLGLFVVVLGMVTAVPRMFVYAGILVIGGFVTAATDTDPGWPLLVSGVLIAAAGLLAFVAFLGDTRTTATR